MNLNTIFLDRMKDLLGCDFQNYLDSLNEEEQKGLRVNTLKISKESFKKLIDYPTSDIPWCSDGLYFNSNTRPSKSPLYHAGLYYIQEPSAMSTASLINIEKNDKVLDLCAAPGGKSTQIASKLNDTGFLICNDISASRAKALVKNIELMGIKNAAVISCEPEKLVSKFENFFDKIIVDAPCSGEGMFKRNEETLKAWTPESPEYFSKIQKDILDTASKLLADGGEVVYSTCTFSPVENENIIKDFLDTHLNFELVPINHEKFGISPGFSNTSKFNDDKLFGTGRILPHKAKGDGHFVALLKNKNPKKINNLKNKYENNSKVLKYFLDFCNENFNITFDGKIEFVDEGLYLIPEGMPSLSGLRVLKSGFYLGELKKNRFEPSQALAMALKKNEAKKIVDFQIGDMNITRYLKGESFEVENAKDGYNLVCINGFPLGFGKVINGRLKNKYLKSWRLE